MAAGFVAVAGKWGGTRWFFSAEGDREGGGDFKTAMPKAGNAAPPEDTKCGLLRLTVLRMACFAMDMCTAAQLLLRLQINA